MLVFIMCMQDDSLMVLTDPEGNDSTKKDGAWPGRSSRHHRLPAPVRRSQPPITEYMLEALGLQLRKGKKRTHLHHLLDASSKGVRLALHAHVGQCLI